MYSSNKLMPPLWIWLLLSVTCLALGFMLVRMVNRNQEKEFAVRRDYLSRPIDYRRAPYILFIGSSLTQCALDSAKTLEEDYFDITGRKPTIRKLWRRATSLDELYQMFGESNSPVPDIMVVEANMFFYSAHDRSLTYKLSLGLRSLRRGQRVISYNPEEKPRYTYFDAKAVDGFRGEPVDTTQFELFCEVASSMARRGTKILLLNYPLEQTAEKQKWRNADTSIFNRNIRFIAARVPVAVIDTGVQLDSTHYIDRGHMNYRGAQTFSKVLPRKLAKYVVAK